MRVLLTRPQEDAAATAELLRAMGHEPVLAPLLSVTFFDGPEIALDGVSGIIATSANGVRAIARRSARRDLPIFAVGPQTAAEARKSGFARVAHADGDSEALARTLPGWTGPAKLLHAASAQAGGRLAALLSAKGYEVVSETLYDVVPADALPDGAVSALRRKEIGAALFYSPMSARIFCDCASRAGLSCGGVIGVCISQPTADALGATGFSALRIAKEPNQEAVLARLKA